VLKQITNCLLILNDFHTYTHKFTDRTMTTAHTHRIKINKWFQIKQKTGAQNMHCLLAPYESLTYYKHNGSKIWLQKFFISDREWFLCYLYGTFKRSQHFSCLSI